MFSNSSLKRTPSKKPDSDGKESTCNMRDLGSIPGLGRSPGEGNGNPLQYFCLENSVDRGAWQASLWGRKEMNTVERLVGLGGTAWNPLISPSALCLI